MKVRATKNGFHGRYITEGETFDVPQGAKATWFEPVKGAPAPKAQAPAAPPAGEGDGEQGADAAGASDLV